MLLYVTEGCYVLLRLISGITKGNFATSTVICVCDLSKPQNVLSSVLRSLEAVEEIAAKRAAELKAVNVNALNDLREFNFSLFKDHSDSAKVKPLDVSVFIIGIVETLGIFYLYVPLYLS